MQSAVHVAGSGSTTIRLLDRPKVGTSFHMFLPMATIERSGGLYLRNQMKMAVMMVIRARPAVFVAPLDADDVDVAVPHAALGLQPVRQRAYRRRRTLENDGFETMLVIEMNVRRRDDQIVLRMLCVGQPLR